MSEPDFVCPPKEPLLRALAGRSVIIDLPSLDGLANAFEQARRCNVAVRCVRARFQGLLTEVKPDDSWNDIPIALYVSGVGKFRDMVLSLQVLRRLNIRVYIPASSAENLAGIRILSSLGLATAAVIDRNADWEGCSDLCTYSLLGTAAHSAIEPFARLAEHYNATGANHLATALFEDPTHTFHVNDDGAVARTSVALARGEFIAQSIEELLKSPPPPADSSLEALAKDGPCSYCAALNVCFGEVSDPANCPDAAKTFFSDLLDAVEQNKHQDRRARRMLWQA
jgi:hypothetical protein